MPKFILDPCVEDELWGIWYFIAQDNPVAATRVIEAAYETFKTLAANPDLGKLRRFRNPTQTPDFVSSDSGFGHRHGASDCPKPRGFPGSALKRRALELQADPRLLPKSSLGKAVNYFLNEYTAVVGYLRDGSFELDNNLVENVTQSFGLHFLCRDANNAEKTPGRMETLKLGMANPLVGLGIIKSLEGRPRGAKPLAWVDVGAALAL